MGAVSITRWVYDGELLPEGTRLVEAQTFGGTVLAVALAGRIGEMPFRYEGVVMRTEGDTAYVCSDTRKEKTI